MAAILERLTERLRSGRPPSDMAHHFAREAGPYPPASVKKIAAAEAELGFALPTLLREIYLRIGNGGFGPGYGLLGITGGATDDRGRSLEQVYAEFRKTLSGLPSPWPERLLPICYEGCGIYECLDCSKPQGQIYHFEPNIPGDGPYGAALEPCFGSLDEWLDQWIREDDPFKRVSKTVDFGDGRRLTFADTSALVKERIRRRDLGPQGYSIERLGSNESGYCECCGQVSRLVWGAVRHDREPCAVYFVHWTVGHLPERGANFDLILGRWGESATAADRYAVSLEYRLLENGPSFMVIDANTRPVARNELVNRALQRSDVVGQPVSERVFAVCDTVLAQDERLDELCS